MSIKPEKRWEQAVRLAKEGKSYSQIAKEMDISKKGVWMHLTSHGYSLSQLKPNRANRMARKQRMWSQGY